MRAMTTPRIPTPSNSRTPRLTATMVATRLRPALGSDGPDGTYIPGWSAGGPIGAFTPGGIIGAAGGPVPPGMVLLTRQNEQYAVAGGFGPVPRTRPHRPQFQV